MVVEIDSVEMNGAIVHFTNGQRALIRTKEQKLTQNWPRGSHVEVIVAESPVF